jgi:ABC-type transporter MlaC component
MALRRQKAVQNQLTNVSGRSLVDDFLAAMTNLSTAKTARYVAEQTEQDALQTINYVGAGQASGAVTPAGITPELQQAMVRSSLDAHVQKAQAQQITAYTSQQLAETEQTARQKYVGKTVKVGIIDATFQPVETYWWNSNTGQFDQGTIKFKSIKGVIDEVQLEQNRLILKPTFGSRLMLPQRKFVVVYIINPKNLQPAVSLSF